MNTNRKEISVPLDKLVYIFYREVLALLNTKNYLDESNEKVFLAIETVKSKFLNTIKKYYSSNEATVFATFDSQNNYYINSEDIINEFYNMFTLGNQEAYIVETNNTNAVYLIKTTNINGIPKNEQIGIYNGKDSIELYEALKYLKEYHEYFKNIEEKSKRK